METRFARITTPVPGPRSIELMQRKKAAMPHGAISNLPVFIKKADDFLLTDVDGNVFIDFGAGIGVLNAGHSNPKILAAITRQVQSFTHTCFHMAMYEPYIALTEKLNNLTPGDSPKKTYLVNSGAEANENAVKIARRFTGKSAIVAFEHAFHGRTLLALSLTGKVSPYRQGFGPMAPEIYHLPSPHRSNSGFLQPPESTNYDAGFIAEQLKTVVPETDIAAFIVEPVLGEGGILPCDQKYLDALFDFSRSRGILIIADEIQTGWGRTGKLFAMEHFGYEPDILVTAKSIASGLPLSAVVGKAEIMDSVQPGGIGSTYSGNPVACAAALAGIDFIVENDLAGKAGKIGSITREKLASLVENHKNIVDVRGIGAMNGIEFVVDKTSGKPGTEIVRAVQKICWENGLVVLKSGSHGHVIRMLPPLTISQDGLREGLEIFTAAVQKL